MLLSTFRDWALWRSLPCTVTLPERWVSAAEVRLLVSSSVLYHPSLFLHDTVALMEPLIAVTSVVPASCSSSELAGLSPGCLSHCILHQDTFRLENVMGTDKAVFCCLFVDEMMVALWYQINVCIAYSNLYKLLHVCRSPGKTQGWVRIYRHG